MGYGGTKTEMERLLQDAQKISGIKYDLSSYADIVDAIHVVQEEMGITGTTEDEAATTIQGSVNMTKAAWQNLMTGLADESADFPTLISNVVDSASTAFTNLAPRILTALNGVSELVKQVVPIIVEQIPLIVEGVAPGLFEAASGLFSGLLDALMATIPSLLPVALTLVSDLASYLVSALPQLISAGGDIILTLVKGVASAVPTLMSQLNEAINQLIPMLSDPTFINEIIQAGFDMLTDLVLGINQALPQLIVAATDILANLCIALTDPANLMNLLDAAIEMCFALADGLMAAVPVLIAKAPIIIQNLVDALEKGIPELRFKGVELIGALIKGLWEQLPEIWKAGGDIIVMLINGCVDLIGNLFGIGEDVVQQIKDGISAAWDGLVNWFSGIWNSLFGNRKVSVDVEGNASGSADGSHANGLSYVPYDGYIAELHRGEMVVPAGQAQNLRAGDDDETAGLLKQILYAIEDGNGKETVLKINNREFGRAVRGVVYA